MEQNFTVQPEAAGTRADAFLAQKMGVSRSRAQKILETANFDGKIVKPSFVLRGGEEIVLPEEIRSQEAVLASPTSNSQFPIPAVLFEDENLLVLNKPRGLTVHAGAGEHETTLVDILKAQKVPLSSVGPTERAGIVHRLDKDTSGAMIVCKTDAAHWKIAADFEARRVVKTYEALVNGVPTAKGRVEAPIARSETNRTKMKVSPEGRPAVTEFEVLKAWERFSFLTINLLTGRTHQIRVHLAYLNHPVVGDEVYGGFHRALQNAPNATARVAIENLKGQALHARKIGFFHPISGERLEFEAPLPPEFAAVLDALG